MLHVRRGNVEGTRETKTERDRTSDGTGYKMYSTLHRKEEVVVDARWFCRWRVEA